MSSVLFSQLSAGVPNEHIVHERNSILDPFQSLSGRLVFLSEYNPTDKGACWEIILGSQIAKGFAMLRLAPQLLNFCCHSHLIRDIVLNPTNEYQLLCARTNSANFFSVCMNIKFPLGGKKPTGKV